VSRLRPAVLIFASLLFAPAAPLAAQQGTVTGHVYCADTNAPARFAKVLLKSTTPNHTGEDFMKQLQSNIAKMVAKSGDTEQTVAKGGDTLPKASDTAQQRHAMAAASNGMNRATEMMNASTVGLDGSFRVPNVKPGTYYVRAIFAGYRDPVSQITDDDLTSTDPAVRARLAQLPTVTITGNRSAAVDLRLERGAAISGRILFDDGTPAVGWSLSAIQPGSTDDGSETANLAMSQALAMSGGAQIFKTDDLGHYRISGLEAGDLALRASLTAPNIGINASNLTEGGTGIQLAVYTGDTFDRAHAKPIHLTVGEEHAGVDITIPARSLHSIVGQVVSKADSHPLNSGSISLTTKDNPALNLKAAIREDGSFHFEYLATGTYTVKVDDAADARISAPTPSGFPGLSLPKIEILRKYATDTAEVTLTDADVDSLRLAVVQTDWVPPPAKANGGPELTPGDLLKGILDSAAPPPPAKP